MKKNLPNKVSIFISVDQQVINTYFNAHDPAPLYKRQLNHQFERYLLESAASVKTYSVVFYKLKCSRDIDRQYAEPLMYAVRRHFTAKKEQKQAEFQKFKRQNLYLLALSFLAVIFCHGVMPMVLNPDDHIQTIFLTSLDIFSWVILW